MNANKRNSIYTLWAGAIVLCLILVLFALLFSSCKKGDSVETTPTPTPSESIEPANTAETVEASTPTPTAPVSTSDSCELGTTEDAGNAYIDKLTFLGDSTTYGLKAYGVLTDAEDTKQVWTPSSGTLTLSNQSFATIVYPETGEEITIVNAVKKKQPEYLVITLGVNGVSFMDEEYFTQEYTALVQSVQETCPDTKIICNSIYPVTSYYENLGTINPERITAANGWIKSIAEATGVKYTNSATTITGDDGYLKDEYCNGDGIHLNSAGFLQILNYLKTHAYQ